MVISDDYLSRYRPGSPYSWSFAPTGYPGDKEQYSMWGTGLSHATSFDTHIINTDADIVPGFSGAPVIQGWGDTSGQIFGVVVAETADQNIIKRIDADSFSQLQGWMDEVS